MHRLPRLCKTGKIDEKYQDFQFKDKLNQKYRRRFYICEKNQGVKDIVTGYCLKRRIAVGQW